MIRDEDMRPGCYDPVARVADMDEDGVWMELGFPSLGGFGGRKFALSKDKDLGLACVEAYNDFVLDEWCAAAPDRLIPMVMLPLWNVDQCVGEVQRTAAKGAKAVTFPDNPGTMDLPAWQAAAWDPLLAAVADAGLPLYLHFGSSGKTAVLSPYAPQAAKTAVDPSSLFNALAELVLSPVFHRHPPSRWCSPRAASAGSPTPWSVWTRYGSTTASTRSSPASMTSDGRANWSASTSTGVSSTSRSGSSCDTG
jgi:predicted TIM-barrel fold metal-dependent hydrolase